MKSKTRLIFLLFLLIVILLVSCKKSGTGSTLQTSRYVCSLKEPIYGNGALLKRTLPVFNRLCLAEKPFLGKPFTIKYLFKYDRLYSNSPSPNEQRAANATIYLPDGLLLAGGNLEWKGTLTEKLEQSIEVKVKASGTGKYMVGASVYVDGVGGIGDYFFLNMTDNGIIITDQP